MKPIKLLSEHKKNLVPTIVVSLILFALIGYIIYINFSYYWDFLHSDIAADLAFIREAANTFSLFPEGWAHINEMRFIYITTIAIPFYWITSNVHLAYSLAVSLMLLVNVALFHYMLRFQKRSTFAILVGTVVLLIFFSRYNIFSVFSILFINGTLSTHLATVFLTIGVYMRIKYKTESGFKLQKALWIITLLLAFAQGIQSPRMLIVLYAPLLFVELLPILRSVRRKSPNINIIGLLYAFIAFLLNVFGMLLINILIRNDIVLLEESGLTFSLDIVSSSQFITERIFQSITSLFHAFGLIGYHGLFSAEGFLFIMRVFFIFVTVFIYWNSNKNSADKHLVHILATTVIFTVLSQAIITINIGERFNFIATSLFSVIFVISLCNIMENKEIEKIEPDSVEQALAHKLSLDKHSTNEVEPQTLRKYLIGTLLVLVCIGSLLSINTLAVKRNPNLISGRQRVVHFLKNENLTVGYGAFWQSHAITAVANWDVVVIPFPFHIHFGIVSQPLRQGVASHDFFHNEERVFLVGTVDYIKEAYEHEQMRAILEHGERHDFPDGWVVYVFDFNPWVNWK
ncbi:MAG: hypothetical protein FWE25_05315 [Lachnospiraceae bacterium]|nr:hypothetical protein [Lachnospiraceae bacterium]